MVLTCKQSFRAYRYHTERGHSFATAAKQDIVHDVKEKLCYISVFGAELVGKFGQRETCDGDINTLGTQRFRCPEVWFQAFSRSGGSWTFRARKCPKKSPPRSSSHELTLHISFMPGDFRTPTCGVANLRQASDSPADGTNRWEPRAVHKYLALSRGAFFLDVSSMAQLHEIRLCAGMTHQNLTGNKQQSTTNGQWVCTHRPEPNTERYSQRDDAVTSFMRRGVGGSCGFRTL